MSEVTGSIGSESVRLRGMALEETQREMLRALQVLAKIDPKKSGFFGGLISGANDAGAATAAASGIVKKFSGIVVAAGGKLLQSLTELTGGLDGLHDQIRASDSAVRQSSTNLRILAARADGATQSVLKFAAEGISQLEEQFDVYKRLSNIGGVVAGDFDNLRINASALGVNMQEYAQLMQENFMNLRLGGRSARTAMLGVKDIAVAMRESGEEYNNQFMRLGIGANDYGKVILENSMLLGGLTVAQEKYGSDFNKRMLLTTKSVTQLGDAFGFNREVVMKAANEALQDARNRTIYNNIREEGKEQMLSLMTGLFGGDAQKGMRAVIAAYTGRFDEQTAVLSGMAPDLIGKLKELSRQVAGGTSVMEAIKNVDLEPTFNRIKASSNDLAQASLDNSGTFGVAANALINFTELFGNVKSVQDRLKESTNSLTDQQGKNLDALGQFQRQNIKIAVSLAMANKTLNNFGLSVALGSQIITNAMSRMAKEIAIRGDEAVGPIVDMMTKANKEANTNVNNFAEDAGKTLDEWSEKAIEQLVEWGIVSKETAKLLKETTSKNRQVTSTSTTNNAQSAPAANAQPAPAVNAQPASASTARTTMGSQSAAEFLLGQIERANNNRGAETVDQRSDVPISYSVDKGADSSSQVDEIKRIMDQANLKQGVDYKLDSNYDGQKGKIDVKFLSQDAAKKFAAAANKMRVQPSAPPVAAPQPGTGPVSQNGGANTQTSSTVVSQAVTPTESKTGVSQGPAQVNNEYDIAMALIDMPESVAKKMYELISKANADDTSRIVNKLDSLAQEMRRLTA